MAVLGRGDAGVSVVIVATTGERAITGDITKDREGSSSAVGRDLAVRLAIPRGY